MCEGFDWIVCLRIRELFLHLLCSKSMYRLYNLLLGPAPNNRARLIFLCWKNAADCLQGREIDRTVQEWGLQCYTCEPTQHHITNEQAKSSNPRADQYKSENQWGYDSMSLVKINKPISITSAPRISTQTQIAPKTAKQSHHSSGAPRRKRQMQPGHRMHCTRWEHQTRAQCTRCKRASQEGGNHWRSGCRLMRAIRTRTADSRQTCIVRHALWDIGEQVCSQRPLHSTTLTDCRTKLHSNPQKKLQEPPRARAQQSPEQDMCVEKLSAKHREAMT